MHECGGRATQCMEGIGAMHDSTDAAAKAAAPRVAASQTSGEQQRERRYLDRTSKIVRDVFSRSQEGSNE